MDKTDQKSKDSIDTNTKSISAEKSKNIYFENNCLPVAILGRDLTGNEAQRLRKALVEFRQELGDFLDADQPIVEEIVQQFRVNKNILAYEGEKIMRRFLVLGTDVFDVTLEDINIPSENAICIERIDKNHFQRKSN